MEINPDPIEEIPAVVNVETAAQIVGLPRRTLYGYVEQALVPVTHLTDKRLCLTRKQVTLLAGALRAGGRAAIREGALIEA